MPIQFHKMHGAGNDFVLLDYRRSDSVIEPALAARLADRRRGIGCDQVLVLKTSSAPSCAARYEVYNADGSPAGQCGNGVRCIGLYLLRRGEFGSNESSGTGADEDRVALEGPSGIVNVRHCADGAFECAMGSPRFGHQDIPVDPTHEDLSVNGDTLILDIEGESVRIGVVSMGNPHAVSVVENVGKAPVEKLGPHISRHPAFPNGCNAGFVEIVDPQNIRLRVYERGSGETPACGSGACAAVAHLIRQNRVSGAVNVFLPGGHLVIKWDGNGRQMTMKGPAAHVFRGTLDE